MDSNPELDALDTSVINSRQDFAGFLEQLLDAYLKSGESWENDNLSDFLQALWRYAEVTSHTPDADVANWREFADMLCAAAVYE